MVWRVLITCPPMLLTLEHCQERFQSEQFEVITPNVIQQLTETELCELIADVDGVIAGDDPFTDKVLSVGKQGRLKALAKWGIGVDAIDFSAAKRLGIFTSNTPNVFGDEVADIAIGYLILLARELHRIDQAVRQGNWLKIQGSSLRGKTAGIIGVGSIGKAIAIRLQSMGLNLLGYDVFPIAPEFCLKTNLEQVEFSELLSRADCIFLACNLTPDNYHLLDRKAFKRMKPSMWLVNVARGSLIEEKALLDALESGTVEKAALDVFEQEPINSNHPLTQFSQVVLGSHNSSNTYEAVLKVNHLAIDNLVRDLNRSS